MGVYKISINVDDTRRERAIRFIADNGGSRAVADKLGVQINKVSQWKSQRSIPELHAAYIAETPWLWDKPYTMSYLRGLDMLGEERGVNFPHHDCYNNNIPSIKQLCSQ